MPSERLGNVDALRAIAALLVFFQHILGDTERVAGSGPFADVATGSLDAIDLGRLGVVLFFLISGFVVPFSIKPASPIRQFVISRVFRLYPAFWASLLCLGAVLLVAGDGPDLRTLIANATMAAPVFKQAWLSGVYWTLFIEILFYALVVAMFLSGQLYRGWLVAGLAALLALSTAGPIAAWQAFGVSLPIQYVGLHLSFLLNGLLLRLWLIERQKHALFSGKARRVIEIGYGGGEHLARQAAENPATGFVGCEVFSGGIGKMIQLIDEKGLENVRLFTDDALKLIQKLPEASVDAVYLLHPDPWPKTRHHKRRFVSPLTLAELARVIKPGGVFHFASDIEDYADWTLAHILRAPAFSFAPSAPGAWHQPYPGWQPTRYEQKARREGRVISWYFSFPRA